MSQPYKLNDVGKLLAEPLAGSAVCQVPLTDSPFSTTTLVRLPPDTELTPKTASYEEHLLVVLEGFATVTVDDTRQTLGSGHVIAIEPGATVHIWNESQLTWSALSIITPPLAATKQ